MALARAVSGAVVATLASLHSARFRYLLAERIGVSPANVHAYIAGEHGDSEIALWSSATVGNVPLLDWAPPGRPTIDIAARKEIHDQVVNAAYEIIQGKGATWYAVGLAVARICEAVFRDEDRVLMVSSYLEDYYGIKDVCLSVPCVVDRTGVVHTLAVPMSDLELMGLRASAAQVSGVAKSLGL